MSFVPSATFTAETGGASDPAGSPQLEGRFDGENLLVPLISPSVPAITDQLRIAVALARTMGATLHVVTPTNDPDQPAAWAGTDLTPAAEDELLEWAKQTVTDGRVLGDGGLRYTHWLINGILSAVRRHDIGTLVVSRDSETSLLREGLTDRLALRADCDVITVTGRRGYRQVPSMLLAVADGLHSGLATDVARMIAVDCAAWIDVLHIIPPDPSGPARRRAETIVDAAYQRIARPRFTTRWIMEAAAAAETIIEQSRYYGITVIGAPTKSRLRQFIAGSTNQTIRTNARSVVLSARNNQ